MKQNNATLMACFWEAHHRERECLLRFEKFCVQGREWFSDAAEIREFLEREKKKNLVKSAISDCRLIRDSIPVLYPRPKIFAKEEEIPEKSVGGPMFLSTAEVAVLLGNLEESQVRNMAQMGKIRAYQLRKHGHLMFDKQEVIEDFKKLLQPAIFDEVNSKPK